MLNIPTTNKPRTSDCPRYTVKLDDPPEERWLHVINDFSHHFPTVMQFVDDIIGTGRVSTLITSTLANFNTDGKVYYSKELEGIAAASGIDVGKIALLQIAYEFFAACTSVVVDMPCANMNGNKVSQDNSAENDDSAPFHIRTMDWSLDVLNRMTIEVDFTRGGHVVTTATTWAGYVGVLTGMKQDVASVSVNYRRTVSGESWLGEWDFAVGVFVNAWKGLCRAWPVSFLVREVLTTCGDFDGMVRALETSSLMAPTYITVAGALAGQGRMITRDRDAAVHPWHLTEHGPIVQTNMDHFKMFPPESLKSTKKSNDTFDWQDICSSRYRERAARLAIHHMTSQQKLHPELFWALFSLDPCLAEDTVYAVAMCPQSGMYITRKDVTMDDKRLGRRSWRKIFEMELSSFSGQAGTGAQRF